MKHFRIIWCLILTLVTATMSAALRDVVTAKVTDHSDGKKWTLEIGLDNALNDNYTAFQMDIQLPEGFSYENYSLTKKTRLLGHQCTLHVQPDGRLRVLAFSYSNVAIPGREGALFTLVISRADSVPQGTYSIIALNNTFTLRDGNQRNLSQVRCGVDYHIYHEVLYRVDNVEFSRQRVAEGAEIPAVQLPQKEGHTFKEWAGLPVKMPTHDIAVDAVFTVNTYTVTYFLDGEEYGKQEVKYGDPILPLSVNDTDEKHFLGWENLPATMPATDLVIHGRTAATGIEELTADTMVKVYSMRGICLLSDVTFRQACQQLQPGLYIINGKVHFLGPTKR